MFLENKINDIITEIEPETAVYDVLIIEDDHSTIMVLSDYFDLKGFSSIGVTTGDKALDELNRAVPKLILLDIILPDISGYEVCKIIKSDDKFKDIPIFYITAMPESEVRKMLKDTGALGFLRKPFNFEDFKILFNYLK